MRFPASIIAMLGALLLAGCAGMDGAGRGQGPDTQTLSRLTPGATTSAQVRELLGPPLRVTRFDRMQREVWEYRRYENPTEEHQVAVQFSPDGIVREVLVLKNYNREPCGT